ncbi:MAG: adenylate kinase family protein [Euryarchaeota archaeon]|nr:adenylate kinase family protein [Euryarchaeota archaeon]
MRVAITGTPDTGKTTIAKKVAERLGYRCINLGEFAEEHDLVVERDGERDTKIVDEKNLKGLLKNMNNVVLDDHYAELLDPDITFVLRCPPKILKKRLLKKFNPEKVRENLLAEMLDSCLISAAERNDRTTVFEIENDDIGETVEEIISIIEKKDPQRSIAYKKTCKYLNDTNLTLL